MRTSHCRLEFVERSSFNFWSSWRQGVFLRSMAESQLKSTRRAPSCGHPIFVWDTHNHCFPCREKGKGQDLCFTAKEEDCFNYLQFTSEQRRKLMSKHKKKAKKMSISKK